MFWYFIYHFYISFLIVLQLPYIVSFIPIRLATALTDITF